VVPGVKMAFAGPKTRRTVALIMYINQTLGGKPLPAPAK
jgi:cytochrome c2